MPTEKQRSQFSAKYNPVDAIGFPTSAPGERVRDVLLCPTMVTDDISTEEFTYHPPIASPTGLWLQDEATKPVDFGRGVRIDRLSEEDAQLVMNACTPRGHYFAPVRQLGSATPWCAKWFLRNRNPDRSNGTPMAFWRMR